MMIKLCKKLEHFSKKWELELDMETIAFSNKKTQIFLINSDITDQII